MSPTRPTSPVPRRLTRVGAGTGAKLTHQLSLVTQAQAGGALGGGVQKRNHLRTWSPPESATVPSARGGERVPKCLGNLRYGGEQPDPGVWRARVSRTRGGTGLGGGWRGRLTAKFKSKTYLRAKPTWKLPPGFNSLGATGARGGWRLILGSQDVFYKFMDGKSAKRIQGTRD